MKRIAVLLGTVLVVLAALFVVIGCDTGTASKDDEEDTPVFVSPVGKGKVTDWTIAKGYENTTALDLIIEGTREDDNGILKVIWSSSMDFRSCEFYALLPEGTDYGAYDGITFKVKLPASSNFLLLMRNPNGGTTWKIWEDYVYKGRDDDELVWVTVRQPFADATEPGWGPASAEPTLKGWLTADKAVQKQINLNPVLNTGGGSAVNTDVVTYFDDIGFYKGSDIEAPDSVDVVWSFDDVE